MTDRLRSRALLIVRPTILLAAALVAAGCGLLNPDKGGPDPPPPFQYPDLSTPQNVVLNLKYVWENRDSLRAKVIYDDAYEGTSVDNKEGGPTYTFSKVQEVQTVWSLGKTQDVTSVTFTLRPETTWVREDYPTDPVGWTSIKLQGVDIQVEDAAKGTLIANSSNLFQFKFVPTLDAASPTDTTWKIIRWEEIRN